MIDFDIDLDAFDALKLILQHLKLTKKKTQTWMLECPVRALIVTAL